MRELKNEELLNIEGGAIKYGGIGALIGAGIVFIIGFVNGIYRPYTCSTSK